MGMKTLFIAIACVSIMSLIATCCLIKFATEMDEHEKKAFVYNNDNRVLRLSRRLGVISLLDNHSYAASERFPYIVAINSKGQDQDLRFSCFGSVILLKWIVTAAHCKRPDSSHRVLLYFDYVRNNTQTYPIVLWRLHEEYSPNDTSSIYDIAVAKITINLVPIISHAAVFTNKKVKRIQASVWKTVITMDRETYLTNDLAVYNVYMTSPTKCYEHYGVTMDETLICVDMSTKPDCFVTEFGPLFAYETDRVVGVLALKPRDCDGKVAVFTNVSSYLNWIIRATGTSDESNEDAEPTAVDAGAIRLPSF